jgi:hypothetical protein
MNNSLTLALFEYESSDVLIKSGDWVLEKPFIPGSKSFLQNSSLIVIDEGFSFEFFLSLIRKSDSSLHRNLEKNIRNIKTTGEFQATIDNQTVFFKVIRCKSGNYQQTSKIKDEILKTLWNFSDVGCESVVFAEVFYESVEIVEKYLDIFLDAVETFAELDQGSTIKLFTIFIKENHKELFFRTVALKKSKYSCFSFIEH